MTRRIHRVRDNLLVLKKDGSHATRTLPERSEHFHTTAYQFAVIDAHALAGACAGGVRKQGGDDAVDDHTPFQAASISKAVFAVAVVKLAQKGILDLDRDVNEYLKHFRVTAEPGLSDRITLRMILGHLAGVNLHGDVGFIPGEPVATLLEMLEGTGVAPNPRVKVVRPQNTYIPRTPENPEGAYSGGGFMIGQQVVLDVLGTDDFAAVMDEWVLCPFGMTDSTFRQTNEPGFAAFYDQKPPIGYNPTRGGRRFEEYFPVPGGHTIRVGLSESGLWTTATDLAKFGLHLLSILKNDDDPTLRRGTLQEMLTLQEHSENGLGFYILPTADPEVAVFGHTGCINGFISLAYFLTNGQGITMMFNSNEGMRLYYDLIRSFTREFAVPIPIEAIDAMETAAFGYDPEAD